MNAAEMTALYNAHGCYYMQFKGLQSGPVCKKDGKPCPHWDVEADCFIHKDKAVSVNSITPKLRELIREACGNMLFVENGDPRFSKEDLNEMMNEIILRHPSLMPYIEIDASGNGDYMIAIYEGIGSVLVWD